MGCHYGLHGPASHSWRTVACAAATPGYVVARPAVACCTLLAYVHQHCCAIALGLGFLCLSSRCASGLLRARAPCVRQEGPRAEKRSALGKRLSLHTWHLADAAAGNPCECAEDAGYAVACVAKK